MKDFEELKKELETFLNQKEKELLAKRRQKGKEESKERKPLK
jgi:hypothetical protein